MSLISKKDFLEKKSLLSDHIMRKKEKGGEKGKTPLFPQSPHPTQEIAP
jgi:hypothetical protein